jgi:hypothetical protein
LPKHQNPILLLLIAVIEILQTPRMRKILTTFLLITIFFCANATPYYISPTGSDGNTGLSAGAAWQTIAKVNSFTFSAGDIIAFEGGSSFSGSLYNPSFGNGTPGNRITITSYGTGNAIINSGLEEGILLTNIGNVTISNLVFSGSGYKLSGLYAAGVDFYLDSTATANCDNITIDNVECKNYGNWGILFSITSPVYGYNHLRVTNCLLHDNGYGGFQINGYPDPATLSIKFSNTDIYVGYTKAYNNLGRLDYTEEWTGSGILVSGTINGLVEYCEAYNNGKENGSPSAGPVGIFLGDSKFVTIQNCISHHNLGGPGKRDGGGFDLDQGAYGCVIQNCQSYENEGAGYGLYQAPTVHEWSNDTVRNNTSLNDGRNYGIYGAITFWGSGATYRVTNAQVYGNHITMSKTGYGLVFLNNNLTNVQLNNNEFCLTAPASYLNYNSPYLIPSNATVTNSTFPCTVQPQVFCMPTPAIIYGPTNACGYMGGSAVTYSVDPIENATGYNWTVPTGASIVSTPPYSTSISVLYSNSFVSGKVSVQTLGTCGTSTIKTLSIVKAAPGTPVSITGPSNACPYIGGSPVTYSVVTISSASGYNWTVPAGASIVSPLPYTNSISVSYTNSFVSGTVSVQTTNPCGTSGLRTLTISKTAPATPGTITGPANVCANIGGPAVTYSITPVSNSTGYLWTVPAGATITSTPPFTTSITVTYSAAFVSGAITVQALSGCANSGLRSLTITKTKPATPGTITGPANVCAYIGGASVIYSIATVTNATGYGWTVPAGATITSTPPYTTSISVTYSPAFVSGSVSVQALSPCGNSALKTLTITKGTPATPGTITGPSSVCAYIGGPAVTYSIATVANAGGYNWTVPAGATINSTPPFTTSINVSYSASFVSGSVAVQALSSCGNSAFKTITITKTVPSTPTTVTGPTFVCPYLGGPDVTYSIAVATNASGYNWTVPAGATITSSLPRTNSITVSFSNAFASGNLTVQATSGCGNSGVKTVALSKLSGTPTTLTGINSSCKYVGVPVTYSTTAVTNASFYTWAVPAGAIINGASNGTSISVTYPTPLSGSVSVVSNTACGSSAAKTMAITKVATPISIIGATVVCPSNQNYVVNDTANSPSAVYTWGVPAGISIVSGQGTNNVTLAIGSTFNTGSISVKATACGITGSLKTLALTKNASCPAPIISGTITVNDKPALMQIYPNPSKGDFKLFFESANTTTPFKVEILTLTGQTINERKVANYNGAMQLSMSGHQMASGVYFVRCSAGGDSKTMKLVIQK